MRPTLYLIARNELDARDYARDNYLPPSGWKYIRRPDDFRGRRLNPDDVVFVPGWEKRRDAQALADAAEDAVHRAGYTLPTPGRPEPSPRPFLLVREHDVTGLSGTGTVAEGVQFTDGTVAVRWRELPTTHEHYQRGVRATTVLFPNVQAVEALHGHGGATRIHWLAA